LTIQWSLKPLNEVDVSVSLLGVDVDDLKGTLNSTDLQLSSEINLVAIHGNVILEAKYNAANQNGLWIGGRLQGPGFDTGQMNWPIIPW
jgi:hypothetical protein